MLISQTQSLVTKVDRTKQLLDRYVTILGQAEHNARLLLDPSWEGAQAVCVLLLISRRRNLTPNPFVHYQDEARILEEKRREEQARLEREAAQRRKEEERLRKEVEAREAAERAAAARGRGTTRGVRGRGGILRSVFVQAIHCSLTRWLSSLSTRSKEPDTYNIISSWSTDDSSAYHWL